MPRGRQRVCLQDGIKIDINNLARRGFICRGGITRSKGMTWTSSYWGALGTAFISADMSGKYEGWFELSGDVSQRITLTTRARQFGGRQWYFVCPATNLPVSVLWRLNGATRFYSRQAWGRRQVAYRSQFLDRDNRAHHAQSKIKHVLCERGDFNADEWDLPPKPKWMRMKTYERIEQHFDRQDDVLNDGLAAAAARFLAV